MVAGQANASISPPLELSGHPVSGPGPVGEPTNTELVPVAPVAADEAVQNIDRERNSLSPVVARLPVELDVMVPVRDFRVGNLLNLEPGQVIESLWGHGEDVPVAAGEIPLAWSEFEVIDNQLAVRITRLS